MLTISTCLPNSVEGLQVNSTRVSVVIRTDLPRPITLGQAAEVTQMQMSFPVRLLPTLFEHKVLTLWYAPGGV